MVAYNFQARFAAAVEAGEKVITIRTIGRRRHARIGERLQLYTGQRTRACRKLVDPDPMVTGVQPITIHADGRVWIEGHDWLTDMEIEILARLDGFPSGTEYLTFHEPSEGVRQAVLIEWTPVTEFARALERSHTELSRLISPPTLLPGNELTARDASL